MWDGSTRQTSRFTVRWFSQGYELVGTAAVPKRLNGVTFAAVTNQKTASIIDDLTAATMAAPVVIVIS